jgi:acyl-CoA dehydrogenase
MTLGAWELSEELRLLQETARRFMLSEVKPVEDTLSYDAFEVPDEKLLPLQRRAKSLGLWCIHTPAAHGGAGLGLLGRAVLAEEAAKCRMGAYVPALGAFGADPPNVIWLGTRRQIEKYALPTIEGGRKSFFVAITEASGGSDPARAIRCRAVRRGDRYLLNGTKMWITSAGQASLGDRLCADRRAGQPRRHHLLPRRCQGEGHLDEADPGDPLLLPLRGPSRGCRGAGRGPAR